MSTQSIQTYLEERFSSFVEPVSKIAGNNSSGKANIDSKIPMYNFDEISKVVNNKNGFHSADALQVCSKQVELIEFKTGFVRRITKENWNPKLATCPDDPKKECIPYKNQLFRIAKLESQELLDSIKSKAAESYVTWEKCILPNIAIDNEVPLKYVVVIDADSSDGIEGTLGDLSKRPIKNQNQLDSVKRSLGRYIGCRDANNRPYYYDSIDVYTFQEYRHVLNKKLSD